MTITNMMFFFRRFKYFFKIVPFLIFATMITHVFAEDVELSEAHKLLVKKNHLGNLTTPIKLKYIFKKTGSLEANFNDRVIMIVPKKDNEGYHNIKFDLSWLYNCGFTYNNRVFDTMVVEYILSRGIHRDLSLDGSCKRRKLI